jgi:hypothetical protein
MDFASFKHHIENCFGIKLYHCSFCKNGFSTKREIFEHLADHHPTKYPFIWHRKPSSKYDPISIESVRMVRVVQSITD